MKKLSNITLRELRAIPQRYGLRYVRTTGGHEVWDRKDLTRTIVFQTHKDPVPEHVVKSAIRDLGISREDLISEPERP